MRIKNLELYILIIFIIFILPMRVNAVTNPQQVSAEKNAVTITWQSIAGEASYQVEFDKSEKNGSFQKH